MTKFRLFRRLAFAFAIVAAPLAATACKPYAVVQQSGPPSALKGVTNLTVGFDWSKVTVLDKASEAEYLAEKNDEEKADFAKIKQETDAAILEGLRDRGINATPAAADAAPDLVVAYIHVTTGIFTPVYSVPSKLEARFSWQKDGKVTDVIDTKSMVGASLTTPSDHQRMEMAGRNVGKAAAKFVSDSQGK
ncbi:hypothetical protein [Nannocystis punicea]|uniref:DUF4410 domain-containing protein n=1 Tax=Nannocystis punicea TaxID=2995304 RepID=A0ABY7HD89_9BACT|nr:hypothetical protein [Nannocystis poenicansa]WAS97083.1 hypothetical protein O0S08_13125 [Nannocystis poenicansa]